ncbi:hypothetical protein D3C72_1301200 [compost metagenome]
MILHHLAIELLAELIDRHDLGLLPIALLDALLQLLQLTLITHVPAASEIVAEPDQIGEIVVQRRLPRHGRRQRLELALEARLQVFDGHLHGIELGQIEQVAIDIPLQRLGLGIIGRVRILAHPAHEIVEAARQLTKPQLYAAIAGLLAAQQIDGVGIDAVQDQLRGHTQLGGALLLAEQLPAIGRKRQQRYDDKAQDNAIDACNTLHPVSILMSWPATR